MKTYLFFALLVAGCSSAPKMPSATVSEHVKSHSMPMLLHSPTPKVHEVHGIDVSKYQGDIDWHAVKADNIQFAWLKATEGGDRVDSKFAQNWQNAKEAGVLRGAYHFTYWCRSLAEQADWFIQNVPKDEMALPPVLDVEWNFESPSCPKKVDKQTALQEMHVFLTKLEKHYGKKPVIYADIPFHRDVLESGEFAEYAFWIRSVKYPIQEKYPGRAWSFWQYTATGRVNGIVGNVDRNAFAGSQAQWNKQVALNFRDPRTQKQQLADALFTKKPVTAQTFVNKQ